MKTIHYQHFPLPASATVMDNGLTVITATSTLPTVRVALHFAVGSSADGDCPGLTHFLEHLLFEGPNQEYVHPKLRRLLSGGVEAYGSISKTDTEYALTGYARDLRAMVEALGAICLEADFNQESVDRERGVIRAEIVDRGKNDYFDEWSFRAIFPQATAFYTSVGGTIETIEGVTYERLLAHHQRYYTPNNTALVVVGGIEHEQVLAAAGQLTPRLAAPNNLPLRLALAPTYATSNYAAADEPPTVTLYFECPAASVANTHLDLATQILVSSPLGLLFVALRTKRRLLYGPTYTVSDWPFQCAKIRIDAGSTQNFPVIVEVADECLRQVGAGSFAPELLQTIRARQLRRDLEAKAMLRPDHEGCDECLTIKWLAGELTDDPDFGDIITKASRQDVASAARKWLNPDNCGTIFSGPIST